MRSLRFSMLGAAMALATMPFDMTPARRPGPGRKTLYTLHHRANGSRPVGGGGVKECLRRKAQIERGQLTVCNGLVVEERSQ